MCRIEIPDFFKELGVVQRLECPERLELLERWEVLTIRFLQRGDAPLPDEQDLDQSVAVVVSQRVRLSRIKVHEVRCP